MTQECHYEECGLYINKDEFMDEILCKFEIQTCAMNGNAPLNWLQSTYKFIKCPKHKWVWFVTIIDLIH